MLSLRRATVAARPAISGPRNFYPCSPCGERLIDCVDEYITFCISIHALLAESDRSSCWKKLSRLDFYPCSPCGERPLWFSAQLRSLTISIHALLAESDNLFSVAMGDFAEFLSMLSLRRATAQRGYILLQFRYFYPCSPCGERLILSLSDCIMTQISIHALLAESDSNSF